MLAIFQDKKIVRLKIHGRRKGGGQLVRLQLLNLFISEILFTKLLMEDCDQDPWKNSYVMEFIASPAAYSLQYSKNKLLCRDF